jgi:hypothetical protein
MEEDLIIEVWDIFREYVSDKNKETAANHYIDFLVGKDVETSVLEGLMGYDSYLDDAISLVLRDEDLDEDDLDEDDIDYYENED